MHSEQAPMPTYQLESEQFRHEIDNPQFVHDEPTGISYAVRILSPPDQQDDTKLPVALNLPFAINGTDKLGIAIINTYTQQLNRPVITMDMIGAGDTSKPGWRLGWGSLATIDRVGASEARVLQQLDVRRASFVGICLGGAVAYEKAKRFGEDADHLVTISSVGYAALSLSTIQEMILGSAEYRAEAQAVSRSAMVDLGLATVWRSEQQSKVVEGRSTLALRRLSLSAALRSPLGNMATDLAPNTRVGAITIEGDPLASETAHRRAIDDRNAKYPGTAQLVVLNGKHHSYTTYYAPQVARLTKALLAS